MTSAKIADDAVGSAHIADLAISYGAQIKGTVITSDKTTFAVGTAVSYPLIGTCVGTYQLKDDAVIQAKIADDAVGSEQIIDGAVIDARLAASGLDIAKFTVGTAGVARIPSLDAAKITTGTFGLARIPAMDDAHIPDVETLSYGGAFAAAQIPSLDATKITTGTFGLARIPAMDDAHIPDLETLSYGGAFAAAQIPSLDASKITTGTFTAPRIPALDAGKITTGTFGLARIPAMDDAHIPDVETLSYGGPFAAAQIPSLDTSKVTTGTFGLARIPTMDAAHIGADIISGAKIADDAIGSEHVADAAIIAARIADDAVTDAKIASGVGTADTQLSKLPTATEGQVLKRGPTHWYAGTVAAGAAAPYQKHHYAGDETVVEGTYTTYHEDKSFTFIGTAPIVMPGTYYFAAEIKSTGGTYGLGVFVDGCAGTVEFTGQETSYALKAGSKTVSGLAAGTHTVRLYCRVSRGTYTQRTFDSYLSW